MRLNNFEEVKNSQGGSGFISKNFFQRALSAIVAILILTGIIYYFGNQGVYFILLLVVARASWEYAQMVFTGSPLKVPKSFFLFWNFIIFLFLTLFSKGVSSQFFDPSVLGWAFFKDQTLVFIFGAMGIIFFGIFRLKNFNTLEKLFSYILRSSFGLIYCALIPAFGARILDHGQGLKWFLCLLAVVFGGDVGAYIFGVLFGKSKLFPLISPKKSLEGAIGGLVISCLCAWGFSFWITQVPGIVFLGIGFLGGVFGQVGDLFESLIKRVAGIKDSGSIMPGHGGILDRIDGVLLAAPLFYFITTLF